MKISFWGASGTVTGSKFLVEEKDYRLLVDCGLFQGSKNWRVKNWSPFPLHPGKINATVLTHAHLDHSGAIPLLIQGDFNGKIYCSEGTNDLCRILLPDSGRIQEEDASYANKKHFSKHKKALPLYTEEMALSSLRFLKSVPFFEELELGPLIVRFFPAGHILGASSVLVKSKKSGLTVLFSGDLGRKNDLVMSPPQPPKVEEKIHYVVMESTYGGKSHPKGDILMELEALVKNTISRRGVLLVPAFAVGRAQSLLYCLYQLKKSGRIGDIPIFLNSPMASDVTDLYLNYLGEHRLTEQVCKKIFQMVHFVRTPEESKQLNKRSGPMVVISASGMMTGGRVLHHVKEWGPQPENTILLVGHQAEGTRGGTLARGNRTLKIHGQYVPINCEVVQMDYFSAHADQEQLLEWLQSVQGPALKQVFLVHGEPDASDTLRLKIKDSLGLEVKVAEYREEIDLEEISDSGPAL